MRISGRRPLALLAAPMAALLISCSGGGDDPAGARATSTATAATAPTHGAATQEGDTLQDGTQEADPAPETSDPGPEKVRDAFAGLQATLGDSCTPDNCSYFLTRVHEELDGLDRAMKADPKGPGHFPEPIAWIAALRTSLKGDTSFDNLKKHQSELIGTRDRINVWMQDHPDDYR
ncbi:hypothetical protein ACIRNI_16280 [Streptomyces sp. NPDC093546]|uniref:hypothetical protein n=1 Tax=Streptomyces sp. NPDC093546 TaxID=3366040 RepID=UPI00380FEE46